MRGAGKYERENNDNISGGGKYEYMGQQLGKTKKNCEMGLSARPKPKLACRSRRYAKGRRACRSPGFRLWPCRNMMVSVWPVPKPLFRYGRCQRRAIFQISGKRALFSEFLFKKILFKKKFLIHPCDFVTQLVSDTSASISSRT